MTSSILLSLLACKGDTYFSQTTPDVADVDGIGAMELSATELIWTELTPGSASGQVLSITSTGEQNLIVYQGRLTASANGQFYMEVLEDKVVGPGVVLEIPIVANLNKDKEIEGKLQIKTNAEDYLDFEIPLFAYPVGYEPPDTGLDDTGDTGPVDTGEDTGEGGEDSGA
jgi:hypothetical protein